LAAASLAGQRDHVAGISWRHLLASANSCWCLQPRCCRPPSCWRHDRPDRPRRSRRPPSCQRRSLGRQSAAATSRGAFIGSVKRTGNEQGILRLGCRSRVAELSRSPRISTASEAISGALPVRQDTPPAWRYFGPRPPICQRCGVPTNIKSKRTAREFVYGCVWCGAEAIDRLDSNAPVPSSNR
jgi:hypothetical protein